METSDEKQISTKKPFLKKIAMNSAAPGGRPGGGFRD